MGCAHSRRSSEWDPFSTPANVVNILEIAYGAGVDSIGYTEGHKVITPDDERNAEENGSSLLYGEILTTGVTKLLGSSHLDAKKASVLYDLGSGVGKLALQAFIEHPNLLRVVGVELALSRFKVTEKALLQLSSRYANVEIQTYIPDQVVRLQTKRFHPRAGQQRVLEFRRMNMWHVAGVGSADIMIMHTELTEKSSVSLNRTLAQLKEGCRFVTYQALDTQSAISSPMFEQLPANKPLEDTFATSWSPARGHHLFCWMKLLPPPHHLAPHTQRDLERKEAMMEYHKPASQHNPAYMGHRKTPYG